MSGVIIEIDGDEAAIRRIAEVEGTFEGDMILQGVGALLESSTKRRFGEKRGPDGQPWASWSQRHGATRRPGQSLLVQSGDLRDSVQMVSLPGEVQVGTNMVYGAIHQFGGKAGRGLSAEIPARPYLGLSDRDRADIEDLIEEMLQ